MKQTRILTENEMNYVKEVLSRYFEEYVQIDKLAAGQDLNSAGFIFYEGFERKFSSGLLEEALPLLVLKALVDDDGCSWIMNDKGEYGVIHDSLSKPVTVSSLESGKWISNPDFDEPPGFDELVLESHQHIKDLLMKKRIFGSG
jgi:hypothetical protein